MQKCDVCGKSSLLPEKFGDVKICKLCFLKVNGLFWKRQYDRYEDAEKHRCKTLETLHKHNFPQHIVSAINDYFLTQMDGMLACDCCDIPVQHRQQLGKANICKKCYGKIDISAWRVTEYEDNDAVEINRKKILKIATKNSFPSIVIDGINEHFDSKIQKGLLYVVDGGYGQKLKVFVNHCVLITNDEFDAESMSIEYAKALNNRRPKGNWISNSSAKDVTHSVLTRGIVKTGIGLATSAAINAVADKCVSEKATFKFTRGSYKIDYHTYTYAERQKVGDGEIGFIRFVNCRTGGKSSDDVVFFFGEGTSKSDKAYRVICEGIDATAQRTIQGISQNATLSQSSAADEILKFKQLLDMGIITQEEFDVKKKELLGL